MVASSSFCPNYLDEMKLRYLFAAAGLLTALTLTSCSNSAETSSTPAPEKVGPSAFYDRGANGEQLANAYFELLKQASAAAATSDDPAEQARQSSAFVSPFLDPALQVQRASGERFTAGTFVPLRIPEFSVANVVTTTPREDITVVRYSLREPGAVDLGSATLMSDEYQPRLTVFRWDAALGQWMTVSHANFNNPVAAICNEIPVPVTGEPPATSAEDFALGESLVAQHRSITLGETKGSLRHPEAQIQLGDGQGWPTADGSQIKWTPASAYAFEDLSVTRNEGLMVLSYSAVASDLVMEGASYRSSAAPRLLTFLLDTDGTWRYIALANFTVPAEVPDTVDCVNIGS
jgi:hypothetical protein